jgi:hypothetical protein
MSRDSRCSCYRLITEGDEQEMFMLQDRMTLIPDVRNITLTLILSSKEMITLGVRAIF